MRISFHGAAGCVTGSKHLLELDDDRRLMIDCGLFQGLKELRKRNWDDLPFDLKDVDQMLLTHGHIDHTGWLPRAVKLGFDAPVHATRGTSELCQLLLMDSAHIQEEDAAWANKKGYSKHDPAEPLYNSYDALRALTMFESHDFDEWVNLGNGVRARWGNNGHILGAGFIEIRVPHEGGEKTIVFSGDIGRYNVPLHRDPDPMPDCDVLVIESTYGDRSHDHEPIADQIHRIFAETIRRKGVVLIPAFAVGRVQTVTLILRDLMKAGELPEVPIFVDSPMAVDATLIYGRHLYDTSLDDDLIQDGRSRLFPREVNLCRTVHESKRLNTREGPMVIISSSGMMTGGRILHHLKRRLGRNENLILLAGYQARGTRGRALQEGAKRLRIHGEQWKVECRHHTINGLSSHGDREEMLRWVDGAKRKPKKVFVVHGEPDSADKFAKILRERLSAEVHVPGLGKGFEL